MSKTDPMEVEQGVIEESTDELKKVEPKDIQPPTPVSDDSMPFQLMDAADDEQVLAEVQGKGAAIADEWIYSFRQKDGKEVTGLSWLGTKNAAYWFRRKKMADLAITKLEVDPDPTDEEYKLVKAYCEDQINGGGIWGVKRQWTKMKLKNGNTVIDPFWYEKGTSKAQRNSMQSMMPADWIAKLVKEWTNKGKVKQIAPVKTRETDTDPDWIKDGDKPMQVPDCPQCHGKRIYKSGINKNGKPYKAYFCLTDRSHVEWLKDEPQA